MTGLSAATYNGACFDDNRHTRWQPRRTDTGAAIYRLSARQRKRNHGWKALGAAAWRKGRVLQPTEQGTAGDCNGNSDSITEDCSFA